jgi:hypothetical protein
VEDFVWQPKRLSMMDSLCAQNPYISHAVTWTQARPPIVFPELLNSGSIGLRRQVGLTRCSKISCPLGSTFRAKLSVMFKGRLLHSAVHSNKRIANCNHVIVQRGRDDLFQTRHNNRHRLHRVRRWLLPPISMTVLHLGGRQVMAGDGCQFDQNLEGTTIIFAEWSYSRPWMGCRPAEV